LLDEEFAGSLKKLAATPTATLRIRLLTLPGVGPETADAILLYALGHPVPVADEYLRRIAERHQLLTPAPGRKRAGYDSLANLTARPSPPMPPEIRRASSTSFMPSRSPWVRPTAAAPPTARVARWPSICIPPVNPALKLVKARFNKPHCARARL